MTTQQILSLEEVNALVPELTRIVQQQIDRRNRIEAQLDALADITGTRGDVTPRASDTPDIRKQKRDLARSIDDYQLGWARVEGMGGVLKDPREGLVDFYGRVHVRGRDKLVWLCWKLGESQVNHYHQLDEGFSARKRIEETGRRLMLN